MLIPRLGQMVLYRTDGRNGLVYDLPAIVTVIQTSHPGDYPEGESNPLPVPSSGHAHLTVFTPGGFGTQVVDHHESASGGKGTSVHEPESDEDFVGAASFVPGSGTYVELDVPPADMEIEPRTWRPLA